MFQDLFIGAHRKTSSTMAPCRRTNLDDSAMMSPNLLAALEREAKLSTLGDALQVMERHVDFTALAAAFDQAAPRPGRERGGRPPFPT